MTRWRSLFKPKTLRVQPSLRGLRIVEDVPGDEAARALYEWESVVRSGQSSSFGSNAWQLADQSPRSGPHPVLRISDSYEQQIACRAQLRWYRRALETGGLQITEDYGSGWALVLSALVILAGVAVTVGFLAWAGLRLSTGDVANRLPAEDRMLAWAVLAAFLLMTVLIAAPFLVLVVRLILRRRVLRATFSARGICATLSAGRDFSYPWTELVSLFILGAWTQARFRDGQSLWFSLNQDQSRTVAVLRACRDRFLPEEAARQRRAKREAPLRIVLWSLPGAGLFACVATLLRTGDHPNVAGNPILAALGSAALIFLMGGIAAGCLLWEVRLHRWEFRRRRSKERRRRRKTSRKVG